MDIPKTLSVDRMPKYQPRPLTGDEIRLIKLQPGHLEDDLYAEIVHIQLEPARADSEQSLLSTAQIDKTLPQGWRSFRTPEGRLLYNDMGSPGSCQYHHPSPGLIPRELLAALQVESARASQLDNVERDQQYEALSYVWGDHTPQDVLLVTDAIEAKPTCRLPITANLSSALRHLRHKHQIRSLWVDAICINQDNYPERNAQVLRIADIFRSAWRVIVWLGEASHDSGLAMKTLQYLGEQLEISQERWNHVLPHAREPEWASKHVKLPYGDAEWASLRSLFARLWFERLWVMQEIALANPAAIVQCGYHTMRYYYLRRAVAGLDMRCGAPTDLLLWINQIGDLAFGPKNFLMCQLVFAARSRTCSVPHDKVYGLLGFFGPKLRNRICPSYELSLAQTFKEVFLAYSSCTDRLDLLSYCYTDDDLDWPSWVPDWRSNRVGYGHPCQTITQAAGFSASHFEEKKMGQLEVTGILHGAVSSLFDVLQSNQGRSVSLWLYNLLQECRATYPTGETIKEALARLLGQNKLQDRFTCTAWAPTFRQWTNALNIVTAPSASERADGSQLDAFLRRQVTIWTRCRFFRTEKGYIGSGPMGMIPGDQICVILGLYCPLVIRPSGHGLYRIIGGCYVHGSTYSNGQ